MNNEIKPAKSVVEPWRGAFFSAKYFWTRAVAIVVLFLVAQLAGFREYTTFLSGTTGNPDVSLQMSAIYGTTYLLLYMACVVFSPIMILAAAMLKIWEKHGKVGDRPVVKT